MEELQSTEVLDREILEDARKKAARILKSCEDSILAQDADWKKKLYETVREIDVQFEKNKKKETGVIMARLPVDKQREKLNKLENLLTCAVSEWYKNLSKDKIKKILLREMNKRKTFCTEDIDISDNAILSEDGNYQEGNLPEGNLDLQSRCRFRASRSAEVPSLTLENNKVRILISMKKIIQETLEENRYELIETLTGSEFLGEV